MCGGGLPLRLMMNSTREEQPREERCSCAWRVLRGVDPSLFALDEMPSTMVASPIYRGPGPLPKY